MVDWQSEPLGVLAETTDYVANGSFESLRSNVAYKQSPDYAVLVRLVDHNAGWKGQFVYVDENSYRFLRKSALFPGDIVIANVGANAGTVFRVPDLGIRMTLGPNAVLCRPRRGSPIDRDFLYYYLTSCYGRALLDSIRSGSAQPKFNKTDLRSISIPIPPAQEQCVIAGILGALDHKVQLNHRISASLEAMARALFTAWFVDFDPVRAKAEGRDTGLMPDIATTFPGSFEQAKGMQVPRGWTMKSLDGVASFLNGLALQKFPSRLESPTLPAIKIAELRAGNAVGADVVNAAIPPNYVIQNGDILFSWSGSLECEIWAGGPGALNQHLFKVRGVTVPDWFAYLSIKHHLPEFRHIAAGKATTMGHIQRRHLHDATVVVPSEPVLGLASPAIGALVELSWKLRVEAATVAAIRDILLPKLVSGEIRVP